MKYFRTEVKDKLSLEAALRHSIIYIERALKVEVIGLERITKVYGSNANSFFMKAVSASGQSINYFLKFGAAGDSIRDEQTGISFLQGFLRTPNVILYSGKRLFGYEWILTEYVSGKLMTEDLLLAEKKGSMSPFYILEKRKERLLRKLNSSGEISMDYNSYKKASVNRLFRERLMGKRYREYFVNTTSNISTYFDRRIVLNGRAFPRTINEIFLAIRKKYSTPQNHEVSAVRGHGDAHHGNILTGAHVWFIDSEYAGFMTPFMELAKPYYNDFVGALFYYHQDELKRYFEITSYRDTGTELRFKMRIPQQLSHRLAITQIKLMERKDTINSKTKDFLSLNDYLVLCHTLTKDPNQYLPKTQLYFLLFTELMAEFNPLKPKTLYSFF